MPQSDGPSVIPARILVPIDFSASSHAALDAAAELAERFPSEIILLHVLPAFPNVSLPDTLRQEEVIERAQREAEGRFALSEASLRGRGIPCRFRIEVSEDAAGTILEIIEREGAGLVVITTHGLSGWYPQVFGSVAEKIVRLAHCPLLLLRTPKPESTAKVPFGRPMEWW